MRTWMSALRGRRSQAEIASALGVAQSYYSDLETGCRGNNMSLDLMDRLAAGLGAPFEQIVAAERKYQAQKKTKGV